MKNFTKNPISALLLILLAFTFTGCDNDDSPQQEAVLTVERPTVEAEAQGGSYDMAYTLKGAADNAAPEAECSETWVNGFDMGNAGKISFNVDANGEERIREAKVTVRYGKAKAEFTVCQAASAHAAGIGIEIQEVSEASVVYSITPEDPQMTYLTMVTEKAYFDSYGSDAAYFADELEFFKSAAEVNGKTLQEYLESILKQGEVSGPAYRLKPDNAYYAYAYGLTTDGDRLTPIYKVEFSTAKVEPSDVVLDISYRVTGTVVTMTVTPSDPEQYYVFNAMDAGPATDKEALLAAAVEEIDRYIQFYEMLGVPQNEAVKRFASKGVSSFTFDGMLEAESDYVGYAVAVTPLGSVCSDVVSKEFRTGKDQQPDKPINIILSELSDQEVTVAVKTDLTDHYVIGIDYTANWEGMSDQQILDRLTGGYQWQAKGAEGNETFTFYSLAPQSRYSIFAFGYVGGVATTGLCRLDITTNAATHADISFRMEYDKYFDGTELAQINAKFNDAKGKAVLPVRLLTGGSDECSEIYYGFYEGDYTDTGRWPDDYFMEELLDIGYWQESNIFNLNYDKPYTMIGFGVTVDFAIGAMSRQLVQLDREGASPASEFSGNRSAMMQPKARRQKPLATMAAIPNPTELKTAVHRAALKPVKADAAKGGRGVRFAMSE